MAISMFSASVPIFARTLGNMPAWFDKAEAHAEARKFDPSAFLALRLAPDMLPMARQVQIASDTCKGCIARLAGVDIPKFEDTEASFADLRTRITRTIEFIRSVPASAIDGSEERDIELPMRGRDPIRFKGEAYLKHFVLPNFFFHCTTAYLLLRHGGVEIGKTDFLGGR
jgi:uncharacterized protein